MLKSAPGSHRGRFAPSPTGSLHLGNARTALVAWLRARSAGDSFLLRIEDLDGPRTVPEAVTGNVAELRWLGLDWDEGPDIGGPSAPYVQSQRSGRYQRALDYFTHQDLTFECWLSRKDLRELASAPHGDLPAYGEVERRLNQEIRAAKQAAGKEPSIRLKGPETAGSKVLEFTDILAGRRQFDVAAAIGDIVLKRADGLWAYQLAVVIDDIAMGIREVVRGNDLLASTGAQLLLYRALEAPPPAFLHVPLLLDATGERLAKRRGSLTLAELARSGVRPERVVGLLGYSLGLLKLPAAVKPGDLLGALPADWLKLLRPDSFQLTDRLLAWLHEG